MNFVRLFHDRVTFEVDRGVSTAIRFVCLVFVGSGEEPLIHPYVGENGGRFKFFRGFFVGCYACCLCEFSYK